MTTTERKEEEIVAAIVAAIVAIERSTKRKKIDNEKIVLEDETIIPATMMAVTIVKTTMTIAGDRRIRRIDTERNDARRNTAVEVEVVTVVADAMITHRHRHHLIHLQAVRTALPKTERNENTTSLIKRIENTRRVVNGERIQRRRKRIDLPPMTK